MPRRISAEVDMQILADLGIGTLHRVIAEKYGVSPSYVSKLSLGKKVPDIHVTQPIMFTHANGEPLTSQEVTTYLEQKIKQATHQLKVYTYLLNNHKGEK